MSKEKQVQKYESKQLIDELSKMPPMVIATAYLHAINYVTYGEDVTKAWITATQQACVLEKAYNKGYYDALQRQVERDIEFRQKQEGITNGDMIKTIFPDVEVKEKNNGYEVYFGVGTAIQFFNRQWWNTSYKADKEVQE